MKVIDTSTILPSDLSTWERDQVYNGLDCCVTAEVLDVLLPQLDEHTSKTYDFSRALQGPCLEMRLRGVLVDQQRKNEVIEKYFDQLEVLEERLERIVREGVGMYGFNWRSNPMLHELFYERLGLPVVKLRGRPTVNRDALEKMEVYLIAAPIISHMTELREIAKRISVLRTEIDRDGRMRTSYNIAGTNTGRLSSSFSEFGTGGNLQNVEEGLRSVFVADPGMKLGHFDGEQIQSRIVGAVEWNAFRDSRYLDACESGDLHTTVAKLVWPSLAWSGNLKKDKDIAETIFYRHYTRRFMCKKLGHGTNFDGQPPEMSKQTKIEKGLVADFQSKYAIAFPAHQQWKARTEQLLRKQGYIIALDGRKRYFWGRRNDPETVRQALAYDAQSSESYIVNTGMLNLFRSRTGELLMQGHDSITVQFQEEQEDEIVPRILDQLRVPIQLEHGREFVVPFGCKTGWNWGYYHSNSNPDGLKDYVQGQEDKRKRCEAVPLLDREFR